jgi:FkbM family methyltransferase
LLGLYRALTVRNALSWAQDAIDSIRTAFLRRRKGGRLSALVNVNVPVPRYGRRLVIPLSGGVGFDNLVVSERWMDDVLPVLLQRRQGAFVDVGANVGQTLIKVKVLSPDTDYVGFEPNPVCFSYTRKLIALNGFDRCTLLPVGLSNVARVVPFFGKSDADVSGSVVQGFRQTSRSPRLMHVAVFQGDALFESLGAPRIGVLKIDVEGGELEVLQGLRGTIERDRPFIVCEILPLFSLDSERGRFRAARQNEVLTMMRSAGYVLFRVREDGSACPLDDIECHSDMSLTNYLLAPLEERELVLTRLCRPDARAGAARQNETAQASDRGNPRHAISTR